MSPMYAGIEAGGTKFICAVGSGPDNLGEEVRIDTTTPEETLGEVMTFLRARQQEQPLDAIGMACFGPVDPDPASPTFGHITTTPKLKWCNQDVVGPLREAFGVPVGFDTDVNGAALGEGTWGAARDVEDYVYITVGTGVGGGVVIQGRPVHGLVHPEVGHMRLPHDRETDPFEGCCPYHGDCLEGLASGTAMRERWGRPANELGADHPGWALEARYIALGLQNLMMTLSPRRVILGGGVSQQEGLHDRVRHELIQLLGDYVSHEEVRSGLGRWLTAPQLGHRSGVLGAIELARRAHVGMA